MRNAGAIPSWNRCFGIRLSAIHDIGRWHTIRVGLLCRQKEEEGGCGVDHKHAHNVLNPFIKGTRKRDVETFKSVDPNSGMPTKKRLKNV